MFDHLDPDARGILTRAEREARELGHRYLGTEHVLLALSLDHGPVAELLAEHGIVSSQLRDDITDIIGTGERRPDPDALLAVLGIDLGVVRERVAATFGPDAPSRAARATRRRRRRWPGSRWWPGCDEGRPSTSALAGAGWIGLAPRVKKVVELAVREAKPGRASPAHLLVATLEEGKGVACQILEQRHIDSVDLAAGARALVM